MTITHTIKLVTSAVGAMEQIRKYEDTLVGAAKTVEKHANVLSGDRIFKSAHEWTAAVAKLGGATNGLATSEQLLAGVSQLTAAQKERLNRTINEAIEKYQALGKTAPSALLQVRDATAKVEAPTNKWTESVGQAWTGVKNFAGALGLGLGVSAAVSFGKRMLENAGQIADTAAKMNVGIETTQRWKYAAEQTGASLDDIGRASVTLSRNLADGSTEVQAALKTVNMDIAALRAMKPEAAFDAIVAAVAKVPDPMRQTHAAMQLLGKGGAELLPAIRSGFADIAAEAPIMKAATVEALDAAGDAIDRVVTKFTNDVQTSLGAFVMSVQEISKGPEGIRNFLEAWSAAQRELMFSKGPVDAQEALIRALERQRHQQSMLTLEQIANLDAAIKQKKTYEEIARQFKDEWTPRMAEYVRVGMGPAKVATEELTAAERRLREQFQQRVDGWTGVALQRQVAELTREITAARAQGGLTKEKFRELGVTLEQLHQKGATFTDAFLTHAWAEHVRLNNQIGVTTDAYKGLAAVLKAVPGVPLGPAPLPPPVDPYKFLGNMPGAINGLSRPFDEFLDRAEKAAAQIQNLQRIGVPTAEVLQRMGRDVGKLGEEARILGVRFDELPQPIQDALRQLGLFNDELERMERVRQVVSDIQDWVAIGNMLADEIGGRWGQALGHYADMIGHNADAVAKFMAGDLSGAIRSGVAGVISLVNGIGSLFGKSEGRKELEAYNEKIREMRGELLETYGSYQQIAALDKALGTDVAAGWWHQGKKGFEAWTKSAEELKAKLEAVKQEMADITANGGLLSADLQRFRDAMPDDADVQTFVLGQVRAAGTSVGAMLDAMQRASTAAAKAALTRQIDDLKDGISSAMREGDDDLRDALERQLEELERQSDDVQGLVRVTATGASSMASILLASWDGTSEGLRQMAPALQQLQAAMHNSGVTGSAAFEQLGRMAGLASSAVTGPMLEAINHGTAALTAMHNSGFLTQETFAGMVDEIMAQRDALLASGATAADVNAAMQADLQRIWELVQDGTYAVDDKTRALLEEAEAAGQVGDRFRSTEDRMLAALERIATMFETVFARNLADAARRGAEDAERAMRGIPTDIDVSVRTHVRRSGGDGSGEEDGLPQYATGTRGYEYFGAGTKVMLHGWEKVTPLGAETSGGVTIQINHPVVRERQDIDRIADEMIRRLRQRGLA